MNFVRAWLQRNFSNPQVMLLALLLLIGLAVVVLFGQMLAPAIAALVIAYILDSPVSTLVRRGLPHNAAVVIVFLGFVGVIAVSVIAILPLVSRQLVQLVALLPSALAELQDLMMALPDDYPKLVDAEQMTEVVNTMRQEAVGLGQNLLRVSVGSIGSVVSVVTYAFLVPFLVFFLLKDRDRLVAWLTGFLPAERPLASQVWADVDRQIGAFIRGKVYEIGIVTAISWAAFSLLGVNLALLLALLTGLSVLVPYVGVAVVTLPVTLVAFFQWGLGGQMAAVVGAYLVIQVFDGNLLAPMVISEAVDIHPVAVIVAILVFGGIWGFWGVFFAIPLATVVAAVLAAWPRELAGPAPSEEPPPA